VSTPLRVVLASGNRGKLREFADMLAETGILFEPQSAFGIEPPEETGLTFLDNALLKARHAALRTGWPAIADDSGLEVDALDGAPGIRSARYAGDDASDAQNIARLLGALESVADVERTARFRCVIAFVRSAEDPSPLVGEGVWSGRILRAPRGDGGFGYDPIFAPECPTELSAVEGLSVAEWPTTLKHQYSHRGIALRAWLGQWRRQRE